MSSSRVEALEREADGYILARIFDKELLARVHTLVRNKQAKRPSIGLVKIWRTP